MVMVMKERFKIVEIKQHNEEFAHYTNEYEEDSWSIIFTNQYGNSLRINKQFVKMITERD